MADVTVTGPRRRKDLRELARLGDRGIVVVTASVALLGLERAERYQWVDYRRRDRRTLDRLAASIAGGRAAVGTELVPESIGRRVVPFGVLAVAVLCVIAAAWNLATGIAGLGGADISAIFGASPSRWRALGALLLGAAALWIATALMARRLALRHFVAGFAVVYLLTLATPKLVNADMPVWSAGPTVVLTLVVLALSSRTLAAWLPPRFVRSDNQTLAADGPAWWRRPAARGVAVYTAALTVLAIAAILPLQDDRLRLPSKQLVIGAGYTAIRPAGWHDESPPRVYLGKAVVFTRGDAPPREEMSVTYPPPSLEPGTDALREAQDRVISAGASDVTQAEPTRLDGETDAVTFSYRRTSTQSQPMRCRMLVVVRDPFVFEITLSAPEGAYPDAEADFAKFLRS